MKQIIMTLTALFALLLNSNAMSYEQARREALFLTDKMAYELNLNDAQYEAAFAINLDYLMGITTPDDLYGPYWTRRNLDMSYVLFDWQWSAFQTALYFYRPLTWHAGNWHFGIYARYPHRNYFYFSAPHVYISYCGGHSWRNNGGRSYYYHHRHHYISHSDKHWGMKDRWDRGDFKGSHNHGNNHGNRPGFRMDKVDNDRIHGGNFGGNNDRNNHFNGSHTLLAVIIRHDRIRLQALRQVPGAVLSQLQFGRLYELFLLQRIVRLAPCCPNHLLIVGYVLVLYCCLKLSVERSVLCVVGLAVLLQCFLLRLKRLLEVVVHLFLQVLRLRRCVSRIG